MHINEAVTQVHVCITHELSGSFAVEHPRKQTIQEAIQQAIQQANQQAIDKAIPQAI